MCASANDDDDDDDAVSVHVCLCTRELEIPAKSTEPMTAQWDIMEKQKKREREKNTHDKQLNDKDTHRMHKIKHEENSEKR